MSNNLTDLMSKIETKMRKVAPYLCQVMQTSYSDDNLRSLPIQFTIDVIDGVTRISKVRFCINDHAIINAQKGELEFVYNEDGEHSYERIIFKKFYDWDEFLADEVSI